MICLHCDVFLTSALKSKYRPTKLTKLRFLLAAVLSVAVTSVVFLYYVLPWMVPAEEPEAVPPAVISDRHGEWLGILRGKNLYRSEPLPQGNLPENLVCAILAAEDKRFFSHGGIDALAALRAGWYHFLGKGKSGASTISMQLAKIAAQQRAEAQGENFAPRSWQTKIWECLVARRWEMEHGKEWILRQYMDRVDLGNLCRGVEAAAHFYFGKSAHELDCPQAALLAALALAPGRLNPLQHPEQALARRNRILERLGESTAAPLGVSAHALSNTPYTADTPGRLTLDAPLQRACKGIAERVLADLTPHHVTQAAIVVLDNRTGEVLVRLGVAQDNATGSGQLDGTSMRRSAGSTLKPFVFAQAFAHGAWPGTVMADVPVIYRSLDGVQAPTNYNARYLGPISVRQALACSQNVPAMEALNRFCADPRGGVAEFLALLRRLGYGIEGEAREYGLGLAIGNAHVTLLEQVRAFAALARGGSLPELRFTLPPRIIGEEQVEQQVEQPVAKGVRVLDERICYLVSDILSDTHARAATFGMAPALRFPFRCACKTGTSSNYRDNWCIGYTREYTVGVWCGNFDNSSMEKVSGVSGAGPIFHGVFELLSRREKMSFPPFPEGISEVEIDSRTGLPPRRDTPQECRVRELCLAGKKPTAAGRYDEQGRALLDSRYAEWLRRSGLGSLFAVELAAPAPRRPAILVPAEGSTVILDPVLPGGGRYISLKSTLPTATAEWRCDTLRLRRDGDRWHAELAPGTHIILVEDKVNHLRARARFIVTKRE